MRPRLVALLVLAAAAGGCGAPATPPAPVPAAATAAATPVRDAAPTRVRIPAIGVDSPVTGIAVGRDGALAPPADPDVTGWYAAGPAPGAVGPALLAGHVDSRTGPAVFYRLRDLPVGGRVEVDRADGTTAVFVVSRTLQTAKAAFPTDDVYAPTPAPELRLVTCGGTFDRTIGHYRDNVVVEAVSVGGSPWTITR